MMNKLYNISNFNGVQVDFQDSKSRYPISLFGMTEMEGFLIIQNPEGTQQVRCSTIPTICLLILEFRFFLVVLKVFLKPKFRQKSAFMNVLLMMNFFSLVKLKNTFLSLMKKGLLLEPFSMAAV